MLAWYILSYDKMVQGTVKPYKFAAQKSWRFSCKIILAPFILANSFMSEKMFNEAYLPVVVNFENLLTIWALIAINGNVAFLSAFDLSMVATVLLSNIFVAFC